MVSRNWISVLLIAAAVPLVRAVWWQAPAESIPKVPNQTAFRIGLGVGDSEATTWDGKVSLERGRIQKLEGWHFEKSDGILSGNGWRASTRASVARPMKLPFTQWRDAAQPPILPNGVIVTAEGPREDEVRVETAQGNFAFSLRDLRLGGKLPFLNGRAEVEGMPAATLVAGETSECDDPSVVVTPSGVTWVFWVDHAKGADSVLAKRFAKGTWSQPIPISDSHHTDVFKTAAAVDASGRVWVVWSSQVAANWDLYGTRWDGKRWSRIERITDDPGPDIFHKLASSAGGKLYLAWQGFREGRSNILLKVLDGDRWSKEIRTGEPGVNA